MRTFFIRKSKIKDSCALTILGLSLIVAIGLVFTSCAKRSSQAKSGDADTAVQTPEVAELPGLRKLMDSYLRDPSICRGHDNYWYLTGTINPAVGIQIWKSKDFITWETLGIVWKPGGSPWHKRYLE